MIPEMSLGRGKGAFGGGVVGGGMWVSGRREEVGRECISSPVIAVRLPSLCAGLMKHMTGAELAKELGCAPAVLTETFSAYNDASTSGNDVWGKKFFNGAPFLYVHFHDCSYGQ
jgi:hypothetical protein